MGVMVQREMENRPILLSNYRYQALGKAVLPGSAHLCHADGDLMTLEHLDIGHDPPDSP